MESNDSDDTGIEDAPAASESWMRAAFAATVDQLMSDFADVGLSRATIQKNVRRGNLDSLQEYALALISLRANDLPALVACCGDLRTPGGNPNNRIYHAEADKNVVNHLVFAAGTLPLSEESASLQSGVFIHSPEHDAERRCDIVAAALEARAATPQYTRAVLRRLHRKGYTADATYQILEALALGAQRRRLATVLGVATLASRPDVARFAQLQDDGWCREDIRRTLGVSPAQLRSIERHLRSYEAGQLVSGPGGNPRKLPRDSRRTPPVRPPCQLGLPLADAPPFTFGQHAF